MVGECKDNSKNQLVIFKYSPENKTGATFANYIRSVNLKPFVQWRTCIAVRPSHFLKFIKFVNKILYFYILYYLYLYN